MRSAVFGTILAAMVFPGLARADSSITVELRAHVDDFCHVYPPQNSQVTVTNSEAEIGIVREICNTPGGYQVSAAFTNVSGGQLDVDNVGYVIDSQGMAVRSSNQPAVRTSDWRLEHAKLASATMPVIMQVTISPR